MLIQTNLLTQSKLKDHIFKLKALKQTLSSIQKEPEIKAQN